MSVASHQDKSSMSDMVIVLSFSEKSAYNMIWTETLDPLLPPRHDERNVIVLYEVKDVLFH